MTDLESLKAPVVIRRMDMRDLEQVHTIDKLSFSLPWPESAFCYELQDNPRSSLWVAEIEAHTGRTIVIGVIVTCLILDEAHIATIAVHPEYRKKGIGRMLLTATLREAVQKGCRMATLEVRAGNMIAQAFYKRFGFQIVARRPRYYRDNNEDALIMTLDSLCSDYLHRLEGSI